MNNFGTENSIISLDKYHNKIRNPEITGSLLTAWFEEPFNSVSINSSNKSNFNELAKNIYKCIIDIDDQIDLRLGNISIVSDYYMRKILDFSKSLNLSENYFKKLDSYYSNWLSSEKILENSLFVKPSKNIHQHFLNKVSFLKLIPLALGEITGDLDKAKLISEAYDYAAIANGYIDDLIDFEEDKISKKTHLLLGLQYSDGELAKQSFLKQYIKTAITYNTLASNIFNNANAKSWNDYCIYQNAGCNILLSMLTIYDSDYILKKAKVYLKGT